MSERDPLNSKENAELRKDLSSLASSRLSRRVLSTTVKVVVLAKIYTRHFYDPTMKKLWDNPEFRRMFFDKEYRTGLLEGSMFENILYFPNKDLTGLESEKAIAGGYVAYDHFRPSEFGEEAARDRRQVKYGRLYAFPLESILRKETDEYTPTGYMDIFDADQVLQIAKPSINELIDYGMVKENSYEKAYFDIGLLDRYRNALTLRGLIDKPIYTITPKGNGLVFLSGEGGIKSRGKEERSPAPQPAFI